MGEHKGFWGHGSGWMQWTVSGYHWIHRMSGYGSDHMNHFLFLFLPLFLLSGHHWCLSVCWWHSLWVSGFVVEDERSTTKVPKGWRTGENRFPSTHCPQANTHMPPPFWAPRLVNPTVGSLFPATAACWNHSQRNCRVGCCKRELSTIIVCLLRALLWAHTSFSSETSLVWPK